jgi:prepilin-type N-terminal cleavage/methylation domain-containing protein
MTRIQAGDTIVEVMIALAIIGSVIAMAYATTTRSLRVGRQAQERGEALKLVEGQIEALKIFVSNSTTRAQAFDAVYLRDGTSEQSFCLSVAGTPTLTQQAMPAANVETDPITTGYNTNCAVGQDARYKLAIERADTGSAPTLQSTFTVRARWERIGGGKDEIVILYKLHQGQF